MFQSTPDRIAREAADWVVLIDSKRLDAHAAQRFQRWLSRSYTHVLAYRHANAVWTDLDQLGQLASYPEIVALLQAPPPPANDPHGWEATRALDRRALLAGVGVGAIVLGAGGYAMFGTGSAAAYETAVGEQRELSLADGTHVTLNANSRLEVRMHDRTREARLVRGEALFVVAEVAGEAPLAIVTSAGAIKTSAGTVLVKILPEGVRAALMSAHAEASRRGLLTDHAAVDVAAESEIVFSDQAITVTAQPADTLARRTLWRQGMLAFDDVTLAEAAADVAAQTGVRFRFADASLGRVRVSGLIRADDLESFLALLRQNLAVAAEQHGDQIILHPA